VGIALVGMTCTAYAVPSLTASRFDAQEWQAYKDDNVTPSPDPKPYVQGGDTPSNATLVPGLPYNDSGTTCGYVNDYQATCYSSSSPDVFYRYTPTQNELVTISLCGSTYDTGLTVHAGSVPNQIACNDDYAACGLQSQLDNVSLTANTTYYIMVEGYSSNCGSYVINITRYVVPECLPCPDWAYIEGEVDCYTDYWDGYNAGCNATPPVYSYTECHDHFICGTTGVYLYQGLTYRDTDWYVINLPNGHSLDVTVTCEVPVALGILAGDYCTSFAYWFFQGVTVPCQALTATNVPGLEGVGGTYIIFVSTNGWDFSWPCGSDYVVSVSGTNCGPSGTEETNWGTLRNLFN
jgi:hypothetical protein